MLQTRHREREYEPVSLSAPPPPPAADDVLRAFAPGPDVAASPPVEARLSDSEQMSMEEFSARFVELRDKLAYRSMRGEALSAHERALLASLNQVLDAVLPAPAPLPADVRDAMAEVARLSARRRNGNGPTR